jgi:hypothetical protein
MIGTNSELGEPFEEPYGNIMMGTNSRLEKPFENSMGT